MFCITLVRHGETEMNRAHIVQSRTHGDLTLEGIQMAENLGEYLKNETFTQVYSSDLKRCHDTTLNILKHSNHTKSDQIVLDKILRERDYGDFEFMSNNVVTEQLAKEGGPGIGSHNVPIPGGESYTDCMKRCAHFFEKMCKLADTTEMEENILVVSHGCWILAFLDYLAENPDTFELENYNHMYQRSILNTSRTKFFVGKANNQNNKKRSIKFEDVACTIHLKDM